MKILILEDNTFDADLTKRALLDDIVNCVIDVVGTVALAKKFLEDTYDVVLLDMYLPDGFGTDLLSYFVEANSKTVVIILTGSGDEENAVTALKSGADDYIIKKEGYIGTLSDSIQHLILEKQIRIEQKEQIINVLYLEHNVSDIDLTVLHFKRFAPNFRFKTVTTSLNALEALSEDRAKVTFDLILLDYRLPGENALELTKVIKQEKKLDTPIIIVTGQGNEEIAIEALRLGVDEYLVKRKNYLYRLPSLLTSAYQKQLLRNQNIELSEREELFRSLFEDHSAIKLIVNPENGNIVSANISASQYYGWSIDELQAMKIHDVYALPPSEIDSRLKLICQKGGGQSEFRHKHADGSLSDVSVFSSKVIIKNAEFIHSIIYDIGKRKRAEKQLKLLSTSVEQTPVSILITDLKGRIEYVNPYFLKTSGYEQSFVVGNYPRIISSGHHTKYFYKQLWDTILSGDIWHGELCNRKKNGELFWENTIISPIKNELSEITHFVAVKEDITDKKMLIDELIEAKEKAEESDRLKTAFLHNISHEIRTPMNAIVGFSSLLNDPGMSDSKRQDFINIVVESSNQLLAIITDIISIATIEAGQEKLAEDYMDVNDVFRLLFDQFVAQAEKRNIELRYRTFLADNKAMIFIDQTKLVCILTNLINNALKFTDIGSVEFSCSIVDGFLEFSVTDTGIGIASEYHDSIFERFRQVETNATRTYGGSGLGLSISKAYVELLGGKIWLVSKPGLGSSFHFTVPYQIDKHRSDIKQCQVADIKSDCRKMYTILVAEDENFNFLYIKELLSDSNFRILRAVNGLEAVDICQSTPHIDVVLMDIKMPVMNGYEATRRIKEFLPQIPVIAQTAYSTELDKQKALDSGCIKFLSKPFSKSTLIESIYEQLM